MSTRKIQIRRDTTANWAAANPVLSLGELALDTTLNKFKAGDGATAWSSLSYLAMSAGDILTVVKTVDGTGSGLDADKLDGNEASAFASSGHNHSGTYQPVDADLTAIAGLSGTSGLLKKTAANTWSLDTSTYSSKLTADTTLYVATTGSDTTGDGSSGNPYATISKALSMIPKNLGGYNATIDIADGTYAGFSMTGYYGYGMFTFTGNTTTPANVLINTYCDFLANSHYRTLVQGITFSPPSSPAGQVVGAAYNTALMFLNCAFNGQSNAYHGLLCTNGRVKAYSCTFTNCNVCVYAINNATNVWGSAIVSVGTNSGSGNTTYLYAHNAIILEYDNTRPTAGTTKTQACGGLIVSAGGGTISGSNTGDETTATMGALINGADAKTTPVDADMVGLMDSAAGNAVKKLSWSNAKAALGKSFGRRISATTLGSEAASVTISTDGDGNSFTLKKARVTLYVPAVGGAAYARMRLNGYSTGYYDPANPGETSSAAFVGYANTLFASSNYDATVISGNVLISGEMLNATSSPGIGASHAAGLLKVGSITSITSFYFYLSSGNLPTGTVIIIDGWDA